MAVYVGNPPASFTISPDACRIGLSKQFNLYKAVGSSFKAGLPSESVHSRIPHGWDKYAHPPTLGPAYKIQADVKGLKGNSVQNPCGSRRRGWGMKIHTGADVFFNINTNLRK